MVEIIEKLLAITERPGMYTVNRVEDLYYYLMGFSMLSKPEDNIIVEQFIKKLNKIVHSEMKKRYSVKPEYNWHRLIRFEATNDSHSLRLLNGYLRMMKGD